MIDIFLDMLKGIIKSRLLPVAVVFIVLFSILIHRIFVLQIVEGEQYVENLIYKTEKERELKSTRGNIYDRNGKLLAYNVLSYAVQIEDTGEVETNTEKNAMIHKLIQILESNGNIISYEFYITLNDNGKLEFTVSDNALLRFKKNAYGLKYVSDLTDEQIEASAEDVFNYLRFGAKSTTMFNISDEYSVTEALKIMTIRYALYMNSFQKYLPVTIAKNIDDLTVAAISENKGILKGVEIIQESERVYNDSIYFSHIIGYTRPISQDEIDLKKEENIEYNVTDAIGKSGIEKTYEDYLRGTKGYEKVLVNSTGKVLEVSDVIEPVAGNDIYLTIDKDKQIFYYKILESRLAGILLSKITSGTNTNGKDFLIPINNVYYALINNNIINIDELNNEDSTDVEQGVYNKFVNKQENVMKELNTLFKENNTTPIMSLNEEMKKYVNFISSLVSSNLFIYENIPEDDVEYQNFKNEKISISQFFQYAISKNWVDISALEIGEEYFSTEELYEELIKYVIKVLTLDNSFNKLLYKNMIDSYVLTGKEICLLLFDQKVIKYNKDDINKLQNGVISPYHFITDKIKSLEITPANLALEPCSGSIIVTDVNTGEVLALVSYPSYDNNKMVNKIDSDYYNKVSKDLSLPLLNRTTYSKTAPGSTFKMITSVAGLEEKVIGETETIRDFGVYDKTSPPAKCWAYPTTHGEVDVTHALEVSCNYFYYEVGYRLSTDSNGKFNFQMGLDKLSKYASMFGLDKKSGIELAEYEPQISSDSPVRSAIGQGTNNFTPSQLARYVTTVANSGICYNLTVLDKIVSLDKTVILDNSAEVVNHVDIKQSTWNLIHSGMLKVTSGSEGTLRKTFENIPISVAAKTGTAQEKETKPNHALCVAYAPYENPEVSIVTVIPNGYASGYAAEVVRDVVKAYFNLADEEEILNGETAVSNHNSIRND